MVFIHFINPFIKKTYHIIEIEESSSVIHGGNDSDLDSDFENIDDDFDVNIKDLSSSLLKKVKYTPLITLADPKSKEPKKTKINQVLIFEYDTIGDIMDKIEVITGIPIYRQHLFYYESKTPIQFYSIINIDKMNIDIYNSVKVTEEYPFEVDKIIYLNKSNIEIMSNVLNDKIQTKDIYCVDLQLYLNNYTKTFTQLNYNLTNLNLVYYGFILKYFPQINIEMFSTYISDLIVDSSKIELNYLLNLRDSTEHLKNKFLQEAKIVTKIKTTVLGKEIDEFQPSNLQIRNLASETTSINLIELFNITETNSDLLAIKLHHYINLTPQTVIKKNIQVEFSQFIIDMYNNMVNYESSINTVTLLIKMKIKNDTDSIFYNIIIYKNGTYEIIVNNIQGKIKVEILYDKVIKNVKNILKTINEHSYNIFTNGGSFNIDTTNFELISYSGKIKWQKSITNSIFDTIANETLNLRDVGIVNSRHSSHSGLLILNCAHCDINNIKYNNYKYHIAIDDVQPKNDFRYLYNPTINNFYIQSFIKTIKIHYKSSVIEFEFNNITSKDDIYLKMYVMKYFMMKYYEVGAHNLVLENLNDKKSKRLMQIDNKLFDLRFYDPSAEPYSRTCIGRMIPMAYTEDEYVKLPKDIQKETTPFRNFTSNGTTYYHCNDPKYPWIRFSAKRHPKGFCLPCCKSMPNTANSKINKETQKCLEDPITKSAVIETVDEKSLHIYHYGKETIPNGREGHIPNELKKLLFDDDFVDKLYLYGIDYSMSDIKYEHIFDVNMLICLLNIVEEKSFIDLFDMLFDNIEKFKIQNKIFELINNGLLTKIYPNYETFKDDFISLIKPKSDYVSLFTKGNLLAGVWINTILELIYAVYGIMIIMFESINDRLIMYYNKKLEYSIKDDIRLVFIFKIKENYYYPMIYKETATIKHFTFDPNKFTFVNKILKVVENNMFHRNKYKMEFTSLVEILTNAGLTVTKKYINSNNQIIGMLVDSKIDSVYLPTIESIIVNDGIEADKIENAPVSTKYSDLLQIINIINTKLIKNNTQIRMIHLLINSDKKIIGSVDNNNLYYFWESSDPKLFNTVKSIIYVPYDIQKINKSIRDCLLKQHGTYPDFLKKNALNSIYQNNLYKIFKLEFSNLLKDERNEKLREIIINYINNTKFKSIILIINLKNKLRKLLEKDYPIDYKYFENYLNDFINGGLTKINEKQFIKQINQSIFTFDQITLNKLRNQDPRLTIEYISKLMLNNVVFKEIELTDIPNGFMSCKFDKTQEHCDKSKPIIPKDKFDKLVEILVQDIYNTSKINSFNENYIFVSTNYKKNSLVETLEFIDQQL